MAPKKKLVRSLFPAAAGMVAVGLWGCGADAGGSRSTDVSPVNSSQAVSTTSTLGARYHATSAATSVNQITPLISIVNGGTAAVDLSAVKVRYWYTEDGTQAQSYWCDYWGLRSDGQNNCSNVVATFVKMATPTTTADTYLELSFNTAVGSLAAGQSSNDIQSRFAKSDWSNFNQSNDFSFDATKTTATDWDHVTLYLSGTLVWGTEPGGAVPPPDTQAPTTPTNLTASNITSSSATLSWTASTDNIGVAAYDVYGSSSSTAIGSVIAPTTRYDVSGLSPSASYSFTVRARDAAGNFSAPSNAASVSTQGGSGGSGSYALNPPDPCYNQFWVAGCETGTCGGRCQVANACSPPEDPQKASLPMTFACPRFMLYSDEMNQAAKDDWGDPAPFAYGVVGHDADTSGLDVGSSSCCQCYQLIFERPEPGSPQPPDLPIPKPMIVQSFNTAAGGGKNFDIYMGAGGFGAFNTCVAGTYSGTATTTFGHFMYSAFPSDFPTSGGIKAINIPECKVNGTVTLASMQSTACQSRITQLCNNTAASSSTVATATENSCIQSNAVAGFYHQNWQIRAKRVECPLAITRVTGCRLAPQGLPAANPNAKTPATADSSFRTGYTTTTMQDCCKPSCAWQNQVGGAGLTVVDKWTSFYSCDQNGVPITAP